MDNNDIVSSLKLVYKPLIMYYGEWNLKDGLENISLEKKGKNLYKEFLERYYYMPLNVIFKDDELVRSFSYAICSRLSDSGRNLYFSKKAFLSNVIGNVDEILSDSNNEEDTYKSIKKALREKKDMYRDVSNNGSKSPFYEEIKNEYVSCNLDIEFEEFIDMCKKKYTKLLSGYNAVLDLFDKPIMLDKFISCFNTDQLYLFTCYSLLKNSERAYELYGKVDYNIVCLDSYRSVVEDLRKKDNFYNSHIAVGDKIYTIDDLFKEYDKLLNKVNG